MKIALFRGKKIRKTLFQDEWWFSVVDVVEALTESAKASVYWAVMKTRVQSEEGFQLFTLCKQLKLPAEDGKMRETDWKNFLPPGKSKLLKGRGVYTADTLK